MSSATPSPGITTERPRSTAMLTPENLEATLQMCRTLASSGSFRDIGHVGIKGEALEQAAAKALARVLLGADLGMSPAQALSGISIVDGQPVILGVALGRMVRHTSKTATATGESYDYAVIARDFTDGAESATVALYRRDDAGEWPTVTEPDGETFATVLGDVVIKQGKRWPEAVEAFKLEQAKRRDLVRENSVWETLPEVMVVWRALSQLVRFHAPDVIGGLPVYTEADESNRSPAEALGVAEGAKVDAALPDAVEAVIARAAELGVKDLNRNLVTMAVGGQDDDATSAWVTEQNGRLEAFEAAAEVAE